MDSLYTFVASETKSASPGFSGLSHGFFQLNVIQEPSHMQVGCIVYEMKKCCKKYKKGKSCKKCPRN